MRGRGTPTNHSVKTQRPVNLLTVGRLPSPPLPSSKARRARTCAPAHTPRVQRPGADVGVGVGTLIQQQGERGRGDPTQGGREAGRTGG
ncbi:hypothetical protein BS50DRAFT_223695 [Corynespora cassiicola Philippines]|uniref:Uncharacterized protein n=1 Tax=Corynespora cassiicola Philippines TaxID=1448308 RepID=A0A2T2N2S9_CORCC|nr:hypothetical protein BS50DRAFT_223695 [Corynespora cassiicola Philippines]